MNKIFGTCFNCLKQKDEYGNCNHCKPKQCFWCRNNDVEDIYVNSRQFCSRKCANECISNFKKNIKDCNLKKAKERK